jgi:hypothetical protein
LVGGSSSPPCTSIVTATNAITNDHREREQGLQKQSYYALPKYRDKMVSGDERRKGAGWWREWPEAWEGIDEE